METTPFSVQAANPTPAERRAALQDFDPRAVLDRMIEIRVLEEHVQQLFLQGLIPGTTHTCQGQEAVCVAIAGVTCTTDRVLCTYRGHGWALALGMPAIAVLAEIMGRHAGCTGGLGGSMHLSDRALGLWPTAAIVGTQLPIAVGAALASQTRADDAVTVAVFGDGAVNIGAFHEALNLAGLWALPVVFVCENNLYAEYSRIDGTTAVPEIAARAAAYAMPGVAVDGQVIGRMREAMREAIDRARAGRGPTLIEAKTYRYVGHSRSDPAKYRLPGELEVWKARDPIRLLATELQPEDPDALIGVIRARWEVTMASVVEAVKAAPEPVEQDMFRHIYAGGKPSGARKSM